MILVAHTVVVRKTNLRLMNMAAEQHLLQVIPPVPAQRRLERTRTRTRTRTDDPSLPQYQPTLSIFTDADFHYHCGRGRPSTLADPHNRYFSWNISANALKDKQIGSLDFRHGSISGDLWKLSTHDLG
jgi:hypothetical protein